MPLSRLPAPFCPVWETLATGSLEPSRRASEQTPGFPTQSKTLHARLPEAPTLTRRVPMSQRFTDPVEATEASEADQADWDDPEEAALHVFWGRLAVLLLALLLAFA